MLKNKTMKTLWIIALVALVISIALAIAGTVLMFFDYQYVVDFDSMWIGHSRYAAHPQSGVMPFMTIRVWPSYRPVSRQSAPIPVCWKTAQRRPSSSPGRAGFHM